MSFLIQNIDNGNVELSENGVVAQIFPPNCEVSQDLTNSKFVVITYQGKAIYSLSAVKSYVVRYNAVDTAFSNGTPEAFAALLLSTVFSLQAGSSGQAPATANDSFCTIAQGNYIVADSIFNLYFVKGLVAIEDTKINIKEIVGQIENNKKSAIYLCKNITLTTSPPLAVINNYIAQIDGDAALVISGHEKMQVFYCNPSSSFNSSANKTIELAQGEICGLLIQPFQSYTNVWGDINFEQL